MVLLTVNPEIQTALGSAGIELKDECIDHNELFKISRSLGIPFRKLLQKSGFYYPVVKKREPTKEYIKMMDDVKAILAQKEYDEMTKDIQSVKEPGWDVNEWKLVNTQMTSIINVLFSMIAVFAAVFYLGELAVIDVGLRVLLSLAGALIVGIAEGWFFTKDLIHVEKEISKTK